MSNPNYDPWLTEELINRHQLNGISRKWQNAVLDGLGLSDAGALLVEVAAGTGYLNGYEDKLDAPDFLALADNTTNFVFFGFIRTPDAAPPTSVLDITPDIVVNTTGVSPGTDYIRLGEVDTAGGAITDIREDDNRFHLGPAQLDENIEANHNQIEFLVIHKGVALPPTTPPTEEGQLFFRTTDKGLFKFNGLVWVELAAAAFPPPPGAITLTNDEVDVLEIGELVRISPGMPGAMVRASGAALSEAGVIGFVIDPIAPAMPGDVATVQGVLAEVRLEPGLVPIAGEIGFASATVPGSAVNTPPAVIGNAVKPAFIIVDPTLYTGVAPFLTVIGLIQVEHSTVVS